MLVFNLKVRNQSTQPLVYPVKNFTCIVLIKTLIGQCPGKKYKWDDKNRRILGRGKITLQLSPRHREAK